MTEDKERQKYYQPTMKRSYLEAIRKLFSDHLDIAELYDDNPVRFTENAVYRLLLYHRQLEKKEEASDKIKKDLAITEF